eukprot:3364004-Rhodomonas_salina.1
MKESKKRRTVMSGKHAGSEAGSANASPDKAIDGPERGNEDGDGDEGGELPSVLSEVLWHAMCGSEACCPRCFGMRCAGVRRAMRVLAAGAFEAPAKDVPADK